MTGDDLHAYILARVEIDQREPLTIPEDLLPLESGELGESGA